MFIIIILFSGLFFQEISGFDVDQHCVGWCWWGWWPGEPDPEWIEKYQAKFDQLGCANFSLSAAHILHGLTVEAAMTSLNIKMPTENGIPTLNPDLSANDSDALLPNIPSRPNGYFSPGMYGFVDYMDHITDPNWMERGSNLERMLHAFHMQEMWALSRKAAESFDGVSEDICIGALDHAKNGIDKIIASAFLHMKYQNGKPNTTIPGVQDIPLTWDDNGDSWKLWKSTRPSKLSIKIVNSVGLFTNCLMRKFRPTEKPIGLDSCCESKTVGDYTYTLISAGKVLSRCPDSCIYTRKDQNGSRYCFAKGDLKVQCLR